MRIGKLLDSKGHDVATVAPDATGWEVLAELAEHRVGALVVSQDEVHMDGIVSERDIVRQLHTHGAQVLDGPVSALMVAEVLTAGPDDEVESLMAVMTTHRVRHVPVVEDGRLVGIVSIGDVVKHRVDSLEDDNRALHNYINAR
ncbi:MAG: CBS domain-containing protein [Actinomycetota bacterium]|nr:CBS domain-containing protein [Actinomycetota bacterium]